LFLFAHAFVTGAIWIPEQRGEGLKGFGSQASWLFAESRPAMVAVGTAAAVCLALAGVGLLVGHAWWAPLGLVGAVASLTLIVATFTPWWIAAVAINLVISYAAWSDITGHPVGGIR
jgi:hypothetical protein